jgi:3-methyladenine DNA glycosylase AlkC
MAPHLKDLYSENYLDNIAISISKFDTTFDINLFIKDIFCKAWANMELKRRMRHIAFTIGCHIKQNYTTQISILIQTYNHIQTDIGNRKDKLGLENMIFQDFVELYGLEDFDISMKALECFTQNSSSEFAIRQFILKYEDATINQMLIWAKSPNEHLRRLSSEGCRPRLPWAVALPLYKKDPTKVLKILELLQDDRSMYVKKSVANNLNDISKNNVKIVKDIAKRWYGQSKDKNWIIKHGCRTLLKQGDSEVLEIFGFEKKENIIIKDFTSTQQINIGEALDFSFQLEDKNTIGAIRLEYSIDFLRLNNKTNNKVFFISEKEYKTKHIKINKKHSFKLINTRKYYSGWHTLHIIVNGVIIHSYRFELQG